MAAFELPLAFHGAAAEGWNPGLDDTEPFQAADPEGFLLGLREGEPIGCSSAVRCSSGGAAAMGGRSGTLPWPTWRDARSVSMVSLPSRRTTAPRAFSSCSAASATRGPWPRPFEELLACDARFFPSGRAAFLSAWLRHSGSCALGLLRPGALVGYAVVRPCREGFKIAPLFADDPEAAERLFRGLRAQLPSPGPLIRDPPVPNGAALALAAAPGLSPFFETVPMLRGADPVLPLERLFAITSSRGDSSNGRTRGSSGVGKPRSARTRAQPHHLRPQPAGDPPPPSCCPGRCCPTRLTGMPSDRLGCSPPGWR